MYPQLYYNRPIGPAVALSAYIIGVQAFFTPALIEVIVEQMNLYARQVMSAGWVDVNEEEIWAYMGS